MKTSEINKSDLALVAVVLVAVLGLLVSFFFMFEVPGSSSVWAWVFGGSFLVPFLGGVLYSMLPE